MQRALTADEQRNRDAERWRLAAANIAQAVERLKIAMRYVGTMSSMYRRLNTTVRELNEERAFCVQMVQDLESG